eukprot:scaffold147954_cov51-Attheya_sp.AAC.1
MVPQVHSSRRQLQQQVGFCVSSGCSFSAPEDRIPFSKDATQISSVCFKSDNVCTVCDLSFDKDSSSFMGGAKVSMVARTLLRSSSSSSSNGLVVTISDSYREEGCILCHRAGRGEDHTTLSTPSAASSSEMEFVENESDL